LLLPVPVARAVPFVAALATDQVRVALSASVAFSVRANAVGVPSSDMLTLTLSPSLISGALFTGVTLMVKDWVAGATPFSPPSATCTVTSAVQAAAPFSPGVQLIAPVELMLMPAGAAVSENARSVPLLASSVSFTAARKRDGWGAVGEVGATEVITGASFTSPTVIVQLCVAALAPFSPPSLTCTVTSALVTPFGGVQLITPVGLMVMPLGAVVSANDRSVPLLASSLSLTATLY